MVDKLMTAGPGYMPPGYRLVSTLRDERATGFATLSPQVTYTYAADDSTARTIEVHHTTEADLPLAAAAGREVRVKVGGHDAVYQDAVNTAVGIDRTGKSIVEPDRGLHSLTVSSSAGTFAVRAARSVPSWELARIAGSLPL